LGEYVLLRPTENSHEIKWHVVGGHITWPLVLENLPERIDSQTHEYGSIEPFNLPNPETYTLASLDDTIMQAMKNTGVLGRYVNLLMVTKAVYNKLPHFLPARLEDVIDSSVKEARDLEPVTNWIVMAAAAIKKQGKPIPHALIDRLPGKGHQLAHEHWLDVLQAATLDHIERYKENIETLADCADKGIQTEVAAIHWKTASSSELLSVYQNAVQRGAEAGKIMANYINQWPREQQPAIVMGTAARIYSERLSDGLLWTKEIAPLFLDGLREAGLIGEPIWTHLGAIRYYDVTERKTKATVLLNGVWFNWLKIVKHQAWQKMADVPNQLIAEAKNAMSRINWQGKELTLNLEGHRLTMYTNENNLFGFVAEKHSLAVVTHAKWKIVATRADDGNLLTILEPL
jgi:hypothetical protein